MADVICVINKQVMASTQEINREVLNTQNSVDLEWPQTRFYVLNKWFYNFLELVRITLTKRRNCPQSQYFFGDQQTNCHAVIFTREKLNSIWNRADREGQEL